MSLVVRFAVLPCFLSLVGREMDWVDAMRAHLVSETIEIPGWDYTFPGAPNKYKANLD
jgi:hypothetical protein